MTMLETTVILKMTRRCHYSLPPSFIVQTVRAETSKMQISAPPKIVSALMLLCVVIVLQTIFEGNELQNITNINKSQEGHGQKYLDSSYGITNNKTKLEMETNLHDEPAHETAAEIIHWNDTEIHQKPPTVFSCDQSFVSPWPSVFPEYQFEDLSQYASRAVMTWKHVLHPKPSNEYDVFFYNFNMGGFMGCSSIVMNWLLTTFKGHIIANSGESPVSHPFKSKKSNMHYFGPAVRPPTKYDEVVFFLQVVWYDNYREMLPPTAMVDSNLRPKGSQEHFMIYSQSNCVHYRETAAGRLSEIGPVHCGGRCKGLPPPSGDRSNLTSHDNVSASDGGISNMMKNVDIYSKYRFCLVMEHIAQPGYITEKILFAFIAGCIPVYYGTESIFDIFNENSFVFYNISDPQSALDKIRTLESDKDAYEQMLMREPIAAHGNSTIEKYFSFDDTIGNGALKRRLRGKLGLTDLNFVP